MEKKILITGIFTIIAIVVIGALYFYSSNPSPPAQNSSQIPAQNTSVMGDLKAMPEKVDDSKASASDKQAVSSANNKFAMDFYKTLDKGENIFYSPYSISTAVAMTYEGANGNTKKEMKDVFYFPGDSVLRNGNAAVYNIINKKEKNYSLSTANALWAEKTYSFLPNYFSTIERYYGGRVINRDFINDAENSRQTINTWVEDQTNKRIKDLIPPGAISPMTRLVLTNAIYFKGKWENEFNETNTEKMDFSAKTGKVKAHMMYQNGEFNYFENGKLQMLEMDYAGKELSMLVLLPKDNIDNIGLTTENLDYWKAQMSYKETNVYFPKFKVETKYELNENLEEMGMKDAFDSGKADFSVMDGTKNLFISKVIHKAFVEVNEEGTEAAAATAIIMQATSMPDPSQIKEFKADKPFIFIIQEKSTGNILFMGTLENPNS